MMLTRDTPWNNFINVELELLISRHGQQDLFYCDTFEAEMPRPPSRMQHLELISLATALFSLPLSDLLCFFPLLNPRLR